MRSSRAGGRSQAGGQPAREQHRAQPFLYPLTAIVLALRVGPRGRRQPALDGGAQRAAGKGGPDARLLCHVRAERVGHTRIASRVGSVVL
jgi:hypothetical protein